MSCSPTSLTIGTTYLCEGPHNRSVARSSRVSTASKLKLTTSPAWSSRPSQPPEVRSRLSELAASGGPRSERPIPGPLTSRSGRPHGDPPAAHLLRVSCLTGAPDTPVTNHSARFSAGVSARHVLALSRQSSTLIRHPSIAHQRKGRPKMSGLETSEAPTGVEPVMEVYVLRTFRSRKLFPVMTY
jgi:hypothetical protein